MGHGFIYGLFDPITYELRYIGKTVKTLSARLSGHINGIGNSRRQKWINSIIDCGLRPIIKQIQYFEEISDENLKYAEMYWIAYFKENGCRLVNTTDGGDGGYQWTEEQRYKASRRQGGRPFQDQFGNRYEMIEEASKILNISPGCICRVLNGQRQYTHDYIFKYLDDGPITDTLEEIISMKLFWSRNRCGTPIWDQDGNLFSSISEAAQKYGISTWFVRLSIDKNIKINNKYHFYDVKNTKVEFTPECINYINKCIEELESNNERT